ncbi:quercetin dioxygenase-like cupin family protein [Sphingobium sp. B1D7B]|uniref:cupin domain-containing protein n=1 Tax=Sphingobium sp. B1D7B TaxID=2940578 RepID=UPI0022253AE6|nr:cupin domain-containing protein [Sphingobium sp. B1D7B]MCW2406868.1 quercetin dioxygenase-like cupin family protein [Sphingobium sp. B1D7B]
MSNKNEAMPALLRLSEINPKDRGGGVRTYPLVRAGIGATAFINGVTEFDPGCAVPLHFHNCEESVMLLEGSAVAAIDGVEQVVRPGDTTFIPAGVHHFFRNSSDTERMRIFWVYGSIDANRTVVATGETRRIDEEHGDR